MQFSAQEEYGLRCLLRLELAASGKSATLAEISQAEGISLPYAAKMMRLLREGGLVTSARGQAGGYRLARPPESITVSEALAVLGGRLFEDQFCDDHSGSEDTCTHSIDCSIRSLWRAVQSVVDRLLSRTTIKDLACSEHQMDSFVQDLVVLTGGINQIRPDARLG